ncbi:MAG: entericidin [Prevotella sp.]|nr:entericidin [Prevotella sp.]MBR7048759.1 entericidin [Prevotella sp.]
MKKLVLMFVAFAAISFASCGNGNKPAEKADSTATDTAAVDTAATVDTAAVDTAQAK